VLSKAVGIAVGHGGGLACRWRRDQRGRVVAVIALALAPVLISSALALDLGRGYILKAELAEAIDAVGLAGWRDLDADLRPEEIMRFFEASFPPGRMGAVLTGDGPSMVVDEHDNTITIEAEATIFTRFLSLIGIDELTVTARSIIDRYRPD
jgi:hypothetical protein